MENNIKTVKKIAEEIEEILNNEISSREEAEDTIKELESREDLTEEQQEQLVALKEKTFNGEAFNLWEYFEDALDIEYRVDASGNYKSVQVAITLGGPNIYIDTAYQGSVQLFWGGERAEWSVSAEVTEQIDCIFEEFYSSVIS